MPSGFRYVYVIANVRCAFKFIGRKYLASYLQWTFMGAPMNCLCTRKKARLTDNVHVVWYMNVSTMLQVSFFSANMYAKSLSEFKRYIISYSNVHLVLCITLEYIIRTCLVWGRKGNGTAIAQSVVREYSLWMHHMLIFDMHIMYVNKFCVRSKQLHGVREIKKKTHTTRLLQWARH